MRLIDLVHRDPLPAPWMEGDNIPWNEPGFSARMLKEHLSQVHDHASRRFEIIDRHVLWVHTQILKEQPGRVLDLGCGPGLYTTRLARLGHTCKGIDFSPASIDYARQTTQDVQARCTYMEGDIRQVEFGKDYSLVMSIFGEFNVFRPTDARKILDKAFNALSPGGKVLMEVSTCEGVYDMGHEPSSWYSVPSGLFSDRPHICLKESFYEPEASVATQRYYIVDAATGKVERFAASYQAYTHAEYQALLKECGFDKIEFYEALDPQESANNYQLIAIVGEKPA